MPKSKDPLDRINIETPCNADWNQMVGNDQVRFCQHCDLSVHDLSTMTRREAMRLALNSKGRLCVRYIRQPDGKIQTTDLVLHQINAVRRRASRLVAGAFTAALSLSASVVAAAPAPASSHTTDGAGTALLVKQGTLKPFNLAGSATLTGTVKDRNGAIIAGANVTLIDELSRTDQTTTTNDEGVYLFQSVGEGSYQLRITAAGFGIFEASNITLRPGDEQVMDETLDAAITMGGAIVVTVPEEPLLAAVLKEDIDEVKGLLARGADVNVVDGNLNETALSQAVLRGNRELVKILLDAGAEVNEKNSSGLTALMYVGSDTSVEVVRDMIAAGAKVDLKDEEGKNALHHAASDTGTEALQALIDAGASVDATDESGRTALMLAAQNGNEDNVAVLVKAGATVNLRDEDDKTALGLAKENDCGKVVDILAAYGGVE